MKIAVIGGGNIGTLLAAEFAAKGHEVSLYTSHPRIWNRELEVYDAEEKLLLTGTAADITDSLEEAVRGAEYIWITWPASLFERLAGQLYPHVEAGQAIGVVPGSGGAEFAFHSCLEKGCVLFGLQRVHSIARLKERGKSVYMLGRKPELQLGAIPQRCAVNLAETVEGLLDIPCRVMPNYLSVTLTPSNPILHTSRLYAMFRDYHEGLSYPRNFLFYEEWDNRASQVMLACDQELQYLCHVIPLDLSEVKSLREHYESDTAEAMTTKIRSINAFKGLTSPMRQVSAAEGGVKAEENWIPDFSSRYFTADFSFGLKILIDIADLFGVPADNMKNSWNWYRSVNDQGDSVYFRQKLEKEAFLSLYQ